jgi:tetratricopeptide (TPR) repeat protein
VNNPYKSKVSLREKIIIIICGVFFSMVILEIGLRVGGFLSSTLQEYRNKLSIKQRGSYRIMCLGESTTARQYPPFLEEILNKRNIGIKFSVIDKGIIGTNTVVMLTQLKQNLDIYKPDMVTVMAGDNDREISYYRDIPEAGGGVFQHCRVYRFMRLVYMHIVKKPKKQKVHGLAGVNSNRGPALPDLRTYYEKRGELLKEAIALHPDDDNNYLELGWAYHHQNKLTESEESFKRAIALNPKNDKAYVGLGWVYPMRDRRYVEAERSLKKAIAINPQNAEAHLGLGRIYTQQGRFSEAEENLTKAIALNPQTAEAYLELGWAYRLQGKLPEAEESFKKNIPLNPRRELGYRALRSLYIEMNRTGLAEEYSKKAADVYTRLTIDNYQKIKEILDERNIRLACIQYPLRSVNPLEDIFKGQEGVIFVDNEGIFKEAIQKGGYKDYFMDMFAGDFGHCTPKGNRLLAENIANVILKEVFGK